MWIEKSTIELINEVVAGHPGAYIAQEKLQYHTKWFDMMVWLNENKYVGIKLWEVYKDQFKENLFAMGIWIEEQMTDDKYKKYEEMPKDWFNLLAHTETVTTKPKNNKK